MSLWKLERQAARVILFNDDDQVFLINAIDPRDASKEPWWEIPGGGIDPGESSAACCARELWEEGGFDNASVGPVVYTQHVEFTFGGIDFEQDEVLHVAHTSETEIRRPQGLEYLEALAFRGARWWDAEELRTSEEPFLPARLPELVTQLLTEGYPDPPIDISPEID